MLKFNDHFDKNDGTKVIFEIFSDRITIKFENQTPVTIFFNTNSLILSNVDLDKRRRHSSSESICLNYDSSSGNINENSSNENAVSSDESINNNENSNNKSSTNQNIFDY